MDFQDLLKKISTTQDSDTQDNSFPMPDSFTPNPSTQTVSKPLNPGMGDVKMFEQNLPDQSLSELSAKLPTPQSNLSLEQLYDTFVGKNSTPQTPGVGARIPTAQKPTQTPALEPKKQEDSPKEDSEAALKNAIAQRDRSQLIANLLSAGSTIGNAIARTNITSGQEGAKALLAQAGQPVEDVMTKQKLANEKMQYEKSAIDLSNAKNLADANSSQSKTLREEYKRIFGTKIPDDVSAKQMNEMGISLGKLADSYENRLMREALIKSKSADKQSATNDKLLGQLKDDLDPNKARGGNLAFNQRKIDQAERLKGLIYDSGGNVSNLDSRQIEELAIGLNSMLSNANTSAVAQVKALVPHSAVGNTQKLKEWLMNDPQGLNQTTFVKRMADTVEREQNIAKDQVRNAQVQRLSRYEKLKNNPETSEDYNRILQAYDIDPASIKEGRYKSSKNSDKPKTVIQNGHTYTLNEKTGKYE